MAKLTMDAKKIAVNRLTAAVFAERTAALDKIKIEFSHRLYAILTENKSQEVLTKDIPLSFRSTSCTFDCHLEGRSVSGNMGDERVIVPRDNRFNTGSIPLEQQQASVVEYVDITADYKSISKDVDSFRWSLNNAIRNKTTHKSVVDDYPQLEQYLPSDNLPAKSCGTVIDLPTMIEEMQNKRP
ncbi:MAG TPA: hypothetical protein DEG42_05685 [Acholeplasmataceae bacterium]|nr:hypothetical protein [Acholeplasmataceae bacterium]